MKNDGKKQIEVWENMPPSLSNDETIELLNEYKMYGDRKIRDKIVYGNMRLIAYFVNLYEKKKINVQSPIYPSLEDLFQEGVLACVTAIERYKTDYKFAFSTFLTKNLRYHYTKLTHNKTKTKGNLETISYNTKLRNGSKDSEGKEDEMIDFIEDKSFTIEGLHAKMDLKYIKGEILPIFSKVERDIFLMSFEQDFTYDQIGQKYDYTRENIRLILEDIKERVVELYNVGITKVDRELRGVSHSRMAIQTFDKRLKEIEKYGGLDFVQEYFVPLLTQHQKEVFEKTILRYKGQSKAEISKYFGSLSVSADEVKIWNKFYKEMPRLVKLKEQGKLPPKREIPLKTRQEINRMRKLVEDYGGRLFLVKYFLPTLPEKEQKVFENRILFYNGESKTYIAEQSDISINNLGGYTSRIIQKLKETDFEVVVDMIDNAEKYGKEIGVVVPSKVERARERLDLIESKGGILKLQELFYPMLSEDQKLVFECMWLRPRYNGFDSMSKDVGKFVSALLKTDKIVEEKLKETNIDELERIKESAEKEIDIDVSLKIGESRTKSYDIDKFGGEEFVRYFYLQRVKIPARKIIFEKKFFEKKSYREILYELGLDKNRIEYVVKTYTAMIYDLKLLKKRTPNYDELVKEFYMKKEFDRIHDENLEEKLFKLEDTATKTEEKEITIENFGKVKDFKTRQEFVENYLSQFGSKKDLVRKFMPTLKKIAYQQVFLSLFLEYRTDKEVRAMYDIPSADYIVIKKSLTNSLEKFGKGFNSQKKMKKKYDNSKNK